MLHGQTPNMLKGVRKQASWHLDFVSVSFPSLSGSPVFDAGRARGADQS